MPPSKKTDETPEMKALREASAGLTYPSESDQAIDVFRWPATAGAARDAVLAHGGVKRKVAELTADDFFKQLEGSENAERYGQLRRVLESQLGGLKVFRVGDGEVKVDVFLIGRGRLGEWIGLHTISVET